MQYRLTLIDAFDDEALQTFESTQSLRKFDYIEIGSSPNKRILQVKEVCFSVNGPTTLYAEEIDDALGSMSVLLQGGLSGILDRDDPTKSINRDEFKKIVTDLVREIPRYGEIKGLFPRARKQEEFREIGRSLGNTSINENNKILSMRIAYDISMRIHGRSVSSILDDLWNGINGWSR